MFRWFLLGFLIYALVHGFSNGWLVIKWGQLLYDAGISKSDPSEPFEWSDFIIDSLDSQSPVD